MRSNVYAIYIKTMPRANAVKKLYYTKILLYCQTTLETNFRGHRIYKNIWTPKLNGIPRAN